GEWVWGARGWWYRYADGSYPVGTAVTIGGRVYRFDAAGYMRVGWVRDNGAWYYHLRSGVQASGWVVDGGSWYYLTPGSGAMSTGWVSDGWAWYRFADSGQWVE
ncbi:MAG: cell wall-binding protein, partial [Actinomyces sp.]|nr:cell wall-binding protein [Actinomyces sp.]